MLHIRLTTGSAFCPSRAAGFSGRLGEIPRTGRLRDSLGGQITPGFNPSGAKDAGVPLALQHREARVFRVAVLSLVLMVAAGQNGLLLCGTWCHSVAGMSGACEHQTDPTSRVAVHHTCTTGDNPAVLTRDDGRRSARPADGASPLPAARLAFTPAPARTSSVCALTNRLLLESRPLVLALRV